MYKLSKLLHFFLFFGASFFFYLPNCFAENDKKIIAVSMSPFDFFIKKIAGESVEVFTLLPSFADHENYEVSLLKIEKATAADIYFTIDPSTFNFEAKITSYLQENNFLQTKLVDLKPSKNIISGDPHYWTSPEMVKIVSDAIARELTQLLPELKTEIFTNQKLFLKEINDLQEEMAQRLAPFKGKSFYSFHPSWQYFAREFGLKNESLELEGREVNLAQQIKIINQLKANKTKLIFLETKEQQERLIFLQEEMPLKYIVLNAQNSNWLENIRQLGNYLGDNFN